MSESVDWEDKKYQEVFDDETRLLVRRRAADESCTIDDIQGILDSLYVLDGNNAEGRSSVQQIVLSATIAAYEAFIHQWRKEFTI
ncbi:hypothetical protein C5N99_11590 [Treponema medium]|uniref:Uncharacterized protein n=2 Tax=Treponema medium TaxID=58231 RepID=A0AA87NSY2_TREMD|nr:hypothetical protein [Treponema medium]EPF27836.1 hypothetical protein HMPREF9195_02136 [Treponema medium ATCC 700293]QSH93216.1 hypothetical protein C5N99_11590 [Treponema medium]QSH98233.1 hypothetical protein DWB79_10835 [Treponema medium]